MTTTTPGTTTPGTGRYVEPGRFTRRVFNPFFAWLTRRGVGVKGARVLHVQGRTAARGTPRWSTL